MAENTADHISSLSKDRVAIRLENGDLIFETGKLAKLANGAVTTRVGDTVVFASACASDSADPNINFFPLRVDYQEKMSSAGKTLGGFIKREGRPTEKEVLTCRLIDRPIRPMFPEGYFNEVQLISYVLSYDGVHATEPLAICAASAALVVSDIPLLKPIGAVRVGLIDDKFVINPTAEQEEKSLLDLVLAGTNDGILMIEGHCDFLTEEQLIEAVETGHAAIKQICDGLNKWAELCGKPKNAEGLRKQPEGLKEEIYSIVGEELDKAFRIAEKQLRKEALNSAEEKLFDVIVAEGKDEKYTETEVSTIFKDVKTEIMRKMILDEKVRIDGRSTTQIRPITVDLDVLPRPHGNALFTRGETQALAVCTLGGEKMGMRYEDLDAEKLRRFYLQYSFPPFSVGEVGRMGGASRREIGHGKLAEKSLAYTTPSLEEFPYTIRLESTILESNGSSSMASVCGGSLAMMAAGIPVSRPISGIAMGLILESNRHAILSDILGDEDALGDMDFKVTGDENGVTAFQLDIKIEGITSEIMREALAQAKEGRTHILNEMKKTISEARPELSKYAPRMITIQLPKDKIGAVIGKGGEQIRELQELYESTIEIDDDGLLTLLTSDGEMMTKCKEHIEKIIEVPEVGKVYEGPIKKIMEFGAFVEILPGTEGLLHISEIAHERVNKVEDFLKEGDTVTVKLLSMDKMGKMKLSKKALEKRPERKEKSDEMKEDKKSDEKADEDQPEK